MRNKFTLIILTIFLLFIAGCAGGGDTPKVRPTPDTETSPVFSDTIEDYQYTISDGGVIVHYIDVGQGDATLIQLSTGENILIDAGEADKGEVVLEYLQANKVEEINYLIATHPHSDHIGGMALIVDNFKIGQIYMPKVIHNTETYENLLLGIKNKGLKVTAAKAGIKLPMELFDISFLAPNSDNYESINDYSVVTRLKYKDHVFLFTGDAEAISGQEILDYNHDIKAHVLDVPHHGSNNSLLGKKFLNKVRPQIAVISVGKDNRYNHPHPEILEKLNEIGVEVLRTDLDGNMVIISDGEKFTINKNVNVGSKAEPINKVDTNGEDFIGNKNSKVLHLSSCNSLPIEKNRYYFKSRQEAIDQGYKPCEQCKP